ncbi:MAG TPA: PTS sugar transporter subunit IIA [Gemmatimonadales bacterium]|jgi:mannitol/fructose-specific phosphotransferase system IIA component (Ntr-type)|nr:PTS sugar transporter subunit IIA [Gemmatimonadales bacterium]
MFLRDFLDPRAVKLDLTSPTKDAVLDEMVALLGLDERATHQLGRLLKRRELLGSTGVGRGIAIPHCRSLALTRLRLAFGIHRAGLEYDAVDHKPAHIFFLIVAPPNEVSNQYLPVLGKIAQFAQIPDVPEQLRNLVSVDQLFALLEQKGL